jgi:hypothetical protein
MLTKTEVNPEIRASVQAIKRMVAEGEKRNLKRPSKSKPNAVATTPPSKLGL